MPRILPPIRRTRGGRFQVRLPAAERDLLRHLADELRVLLGTEDPALVRLFPPGYASDPESDAQYRDMVKGDLTAERLAGLQTLERTLGSTSLDEEELGSWLSAINDMRLVLGTRLDVTEEINERGLRPGDDRASQFEVYGYLTWLESQLVEAMAAGLPGEGGS